jgi:methanol metabolism-related c-type cytochrome
MLNLRASMAVIAAAVLIPVMAAPLPVLAADGPVPGRDGVTVADGKYTTEDGGVTYNIGEDGTVDWYTYSGFRRYHSECHVCHGPDALGSTYAPSLAESVKTMDFYQYSEVVMSGRENKKPDGSISKMPAFGDNQNVACYVEDIYAYLKARADGKLQRGRPQKKAEKPQSAKDAESACLNP